MRESGCTGDAIAFAAGIVAIGTAAPRPVRFARFFPNITSPSRSPPTRLVPGRSPNNPRVRWVPVYSRAGGLVFTGDPTEGHTWLFGDGARVPPRAAKVNRNSGNDRTMDAEEEQTRAKIDCPAIERQPRSV